MAFQTVPDKATGDVFTEAMWDLLKDNINGAIPVVLADSTLSVAAASIDFTGIAQDWAHLHLIGYLRGSTAATATQVYMRINGDAGSNYDFQQLYGQASTAAAGETFAADKAQVGACAAASAGANLFSPFTADIPFYAGGDNNKTISSAFSYKTGTSSGNLQVSSMGAFWRSNAAITSISLFPSAGNFTAGSRVTLYGMP